MKPQNLLFLFSDQHSRKALGCYGHPLVKTPYLDQLASEGTLFKNAYCNSPICVPARGALATGRYVFETGYWDNAKAYEGSLPSWHHRLNSKGNRCESIGKLHFRSSNDPTGFAESHLPMNIVGGVGDLLGSLRDGTARLRKYRSYIHNSGPGNSTYIDYDRQITDSAVEWLKTSAAKYSDQPWVLFVSLVCPHPPIIAPEEFFKLYPLKDISLPHPFEPEKHTDHPYLRDIRDFLGLNEGFKEEEILRSIAAYYGQCSYLDSNLGRILNALEENGLRSSTRILYSSDHGESNGNRGIWGKSNMYEEAVGVPMILSGQDVPKGNTIETPVSLVDCFPTILECVGQELTDEDHVLRGRSLFKIANGEDTDRIAFSEFHAAGSRTAFYMVRQGPNKLVHFVDYPNQLFDLNKDPDEMENLSGNPVFDDIETSLSRKLHQLMDPVMTHKLARKDQLSRIAAAGGREVILDRGSFGYTPAPGEAVRYQ
tara:strand:+ start:408 stop:1859 length:1452 start_codon:yes stop_codon:yes gene_type:complete